MNQINPKRLIKGLALREKHYLLKLDLLRVLLVVPEQSHGIDKKIVDWAKSIGLYVKHFETNNFDGGFWLCSLDPSNLKMTDEEIKNDFREKTLKKIL